MKKIVAYILSITMAALVFYGGAGITIVSYCCNTCRSAGIEALTNDKCCEIHHHQHQECEHTRDHEHTGIEKNCCFMEHINFDWNAQDAVKQFIPTASTTYCLLPWLYSGLTTPLFVSDANTPHYADGPPLTAPRDYLSLLTVLLI